MHSVIKLGVMTALFVLVGFDTPVIAQTKTQIDPDEKFIKQISAGGSHTCGVTNKGNVICWGDNEEGQLGVGTDDIMDGPVPVSDISGAVMVACSRRSTCALRNTGDVWCWGDNTYGQLGNGNTKPSLKPVKVIGVEGATYIAAGEGHVCAIVKSGRIKCWGENSFGQLGDGKGPGGGGDFFLPVSRPVNVKYIVNAVSIAAGGSHTCALERSGRVKCWGKNEDGQLGVADSDTVDFINKPVIVKGVKDVTSITAGNAHTCAIEKQNHIKCWGAETAGPTGITFNTDARDQIDMQQQTPTIKMTAGGHHTCSLTSSGSVYCWGGYGFGEGGIKDGQGRVAGIHDVVDIAAGWVHTCALENSGKVFCWGANGKGALGNGYSAIAKKPIRIAGISNTVQIATGDYHTCALLKDGGLRCWGSNIYGEAGARNQRYVTTPTAPIGPAKATYLSTGWAHTCAIAIDQSVKCFGENDKGQLGDGKGGPNTMSVEPVSVIGIVDAKALSSGGQYTCGLTTGGKAYCWGRNSHFLHSQVIREEVSAFGDAEEIVASANFTCARMKDGKVLCFSDNSRLITGLNDTGMLRDENGLIALAPFKGAKALSVGHSSACVILQDGALIKCIGEFARFTREMRGGDFEPIEYEPIPDDLNRLTGSIGVAVGRNHACVITKEKKVRCWGDNSRGQLGDGKGGPYRFSTTSREAVGIVNAEKIVAADDHTCVLLSNGTGMCWGENESHQVGDGMPHYIEEPVEVTW